VLQYSLKVDKSKSSPCVIAIETALIVVIVSCCCFLDLCEDRVDSCDPAFICHLYFGSTGLLDFQIFLIAVENGHGSE
jgi:hypothetical protein